MSINQIIIEYLKVILNWPVAILVVSIIFMFKFSDSIRLFLEKHSLKKAGPLEFELQQKEKEPIEKIEENLEQKGITLSEEQINLLEEKFNKLSNAVNIKDEEIKQKDELIGYLVYRAELFESRYLSYFYVYNTKNVLFWFYKVTQTTKDLYNITFQLNIPSSLERETIFNVLLNFGMIELSTGNSYRISDKGHRFLRFIRWVK